MIENSRAGGLPRWLVVVLAVKLLLLAAIAIVVVAYGRG